MISYGGSDYNLTVLVEAADKRRTLLALSDHLFGSKDAKKGADK
jgi:aspartate kinase